MECVVVARDESEGASTQVEVPGPHGSRPPEINAAALQIQDIVIPKIFLKGQDRSQWIVNGLYLQ